MQVLSVSGDTIVLHPLMEHRLWKAAKTDEFWAAWHTYHRSAKNLQERSDRAIEFAAVLNSGKKFLPGQIYHQPVPRAKPTHKWTRWASCTAAALLTLVCFMTLPKQAEAPITQHVEVQTVHEQPEVVASEPAVMFNVIPTPVIPEVIEYEWYVGDRGLDTIRTVYNFCHTQFADAYDWVAQYYNIPEGRAPVNFGRTLSMGIAANVMRETTGNPGVMAREEDGRTFYGIIQWGGGRQQNLLTFLDRHGFARDDLKGQLLFLAKEYYTTAEYKNYQSFSQLFDCDDTDFDTISLAAERFRVKVERGGSRETMDEILRNWGNRWNYSWGDKPEGGLHAYMQSF